MRPSAGNPQTPTPGPDSMQTKEAQSAPVVHGNPSRSIFPTAQTALSESQTVPGPQALGKAQGAPGGGSWAARSQVRHAVGAAAGETEVAGDQTVAAAGRAGGSPRLADAGRIEARADTDEP